MPTATRIDLNIKKSKGSVTPDDIARALGQSKKLGGSHAMNSAKNALSGMNSISAVKHVAGAVVGGVVKGMGVISSIISALSTALTVAGVAQKFLNRFKGGPFKYQKYLWEGVWGMVLIHIVYNCSTGQYVARIQGFWRDPKTEYTERFGGAGRDDVSPGRRGSFDIIIYGNA